MYFGHDVCLYVCVFWNEMLSRSWHITRCTSDLRCCNLFTVVSSIRVMRPSKGELRISRVWISKPVVSCIRGSHVAVSIYSCICTFVYHCRSFNPSLCRLSPFLLSYHAVSRSRRFLEFYLSNASVIVLTSNLPISYNVSDLVRFLYSPKHLLFAHVSTWFVWIVWSWCMHNKRMGLCGNLTLRERNIWLFSSFFTFLGW